MTTLITAMGDVTDVVANIFDIMTANPYLLFILAAGLVTIGVSVFSSIKSAAR